MFCDCSDSSGIIQPECDPIHTLVRRSGVNIVVKSLRQSELIRAIAAETPESMREATRLVDRDVSDVHSDLKQLEVLGILTIEAGGPSGAIHIDYPLIDRDADSASTSA